MEAPKFRVQRPGWARIVCLQGHKSLFVARLTDCGQKQVKLQYAEALAICERLKLECGDNDIADWQRCVIFLDNSQWQSAFDYSKPLIHRMFQDAGFIAGLSAFELGERLSAVKYFLYATVHSPRAAHMLVKSVEHFKTPITSHQIDDHNAGIYLVRDLQS